MTAALEEAIDPRLGSTKPRLFTPPLRVNCTGAKVDPRLPPKHPLFETPQECACGCGLNPETSWGFTCIEFLEKVVKWELLEWQKWLYIHALEKRPDGTGFRFRQLLVLVGRQQGKTTWGRGLGLWRLFMDPEGKRSPDWPAAKLCVVAAQNLDYAENTLKDVVDEIRLHPLLTRELKNHAVTNGKHRAILTNNRFWRAATANRKGGRSLPVDFAWLDEVREHTTWDAYNAIEPTTTMQVCSQLLVTSNAGDQRSIVLRGLRDTQIRDLTVGNTEDAFTGFFEWSVPDDVDPRKPEYWYMAAPAMGRKIEGVVRLQLEDLIGKFKAKVDTDMAGFQTEYLCQWVDSLLPGVIPSQAWADCLDEDSRRDPKAPVYACIEVNYHRTKSYVCIAAKRPDGDIHTEVIKDFKGTEDIAKWFNEPGDNPLLDEEGNPLPRKRKFAAICAQKTGAPVSTELEEFRKAGLNIIEWGAPTAQLVAAAGDFYDGIVGEADDRPDRVQPNAPIQPVKKVWHRKQQALNRAAASTVSRTILDAWFFDRRRSPVDAAPLIGCCGATWLLNNPPPTAAPEIWEWPDDDTIEKWRQESEEQWEKDDDE